LPVQEASQGRAWQRLSAPHVSTSEHGVPVEQPAWHVMAVPLPLWQEHGAGSQISPMPQSASLMHELGPIKQMPQPGSMGGTWHCSKLPPVWQSLSEWQHSGLAQPRPGHSGPGSPIAPQPAKAGVHEQAKQVNTTQSGRALHDA